MNLNKRRRMLTKTGETLYFNPVTGQYYPRILDFTPTATYSGTLSNRWARCTYLEEATIKNATSIGRANWGNEPFEKCTNLKKLIITHGCSDGNTYIATGCPKLEYIQIGSIGHVNHKLYGSSFSGSGASAANKTLTVYVTDTETIPVSGAPWGFTGATVIYRSSTTGEIREVPTE